MLELTAANSPARIALSEKHARIVISHSDYLLVVCLHCGGAKSLVLHKVAGAARVPNVFECSCNPPVVYPVASFDIPEQEKV